ncbi:class I adenylate-forming enzyme family protein [Steroidobacter agaridevorans]|uniref:class I adenylate-forming enzyme family protein n=1 Tax=Steroidobacter agaridevorans TaxID=2695856 RepID=UPI0013207927|nr:AMP-binding protein [Steroidobacter agaridevorans]GFE85562.1 long-chain-fatty-acid--CoA ligase FadD13 [Steroidobacter agaridevorans]
MNFTIARALRFWSEETPDQPALSYEDRSVSFKELHAWAGRVAHDLYLRGVRPGDRVSIVGTNSLDYAVLACGLIRLGAIGAPLSFRSTASELREWFGELSPTLIFADAERSAAVAEALGETAAKKLLSLESVIPALRTGPALAPTHEPADEAPAFIIGTSGSTGRPKGVIYTHRMVVTYASEFVLMEPKCGRGSSVLMVGPFSSGSGYLVMTQGLTQGATVYIESKFVPERALDLLTRHRITSFMAAPIFFERIAALPAFAEADLSHLYWTQVGGARVSAALLSAWRSKGVVLRHAYGSTEAGGAWGARSDVAVAEPHKCGRGGMFSEYAIRLNDGTIARQGGPGEILIRSACMTAGLWNNESGTREILRDDWLHTGDLGEIDATGNLTFIDRIKDIIISGGLNISAAEVERVIADVPGVLEVAVIVAADASFGETPLAIVHGDATCMTTTIIDHCNRHLANYKVPRYVAIECEPLPRLPSGKVAKPLLRQKYQGAETWLPKVR